MILGDIETARQQAAVRREKALAPTRALEAAEAELADIDEHSQQPASRHWRSNVRLSSGRTRLHQPGRATITIGISARHAAISTAHACSLSNWVSQTLVTG